MLNWCVIVLLVIIDQLTKMLAITYLKPITTQNFLDGVVNFTYVENTGVAFGMFKDMHYLIVPITIVVTCICLYFMLKAKKENYSKLSYVFGVISAGAIGNILDKIFRGFVVDFIEFDFVQFPVFNFADICVSLGAVAFAVLIIFTKDGEFFADKK